MHTVLAQLCLLLESRICGSLVSLLRVSQDGQRLGDCIGPNLPKAYRLALESLPVAENAGSCGTAAYRREAVFVTDTLNDPLWSDYHALALKYGIKACWSQPVFNPDGHLVGSLSAAHAVTKSPQDSDRAQMSQTAALAGVIMAFANFDNELRDSQARLDWALSSSLAGMWDTNLTTGTVTRSPGFMRALGFEDNELGPERRNWRQRIHGADLAHHDAQVNACAQGQATRFELEYRIRDKQGNWRWILDRGQRMPRDPDTGQVHMRGFYSDITALKHTQQSLALSEQRFRDFAHTAADIFWEQDTQLRFTWVSDNVRQLTGLQLADLYHKRRDELVSKQQLRSAHWRRHLAQLQARQPFANFEYHLDGPGLSHKYLLVSGLPVFDADGQFSGYRGSARDITEQRRLLDQMTHAASHDGLTGLVNRREFEKLLALNLTDARRDGLQRAICFLDLDRFKQVNDSAGHAVGDALLAALAGMMQQRVRENDVLARLGGDEFGLLLKDCPANKAREICQQLIQSVNDFCLNWQGGACTVGLSVGVAMAGPDQGPNELLTRADTACYAAKERGRNCVWLFDSADTV